MRRHSNRLVSNRRFRLSVHMIILTFLFQSISIVCAKFDTAVSSNISDMVYIPAGEFQMGNHFYDGDTSFSIPVHPVFISGFFIGKYEITNQQYCDFLNSIDVVVEDGAVYSRDDVEHDYIYYSLTRGIYEYQIGIEQEGIFKPVFYMPVSMPDYPGQDLANHPVVLTWYGAVAYCNWRSKQEGYETCYDLSTWECDFMKHGYRLPTEAEWEYAARGGYHDPYFKYPWGSNEADCSKGNHYQCNSWRELRYPHTTHVGYYPPYGYGLCNTYGNVSEWCNDRYQPNYYEWSPYDNPTGPQSIWEFPDSDVRGRRFPNRVVRGGNCTVTAYHCQNGGRGSVAPNWIRPRSGFRIALALDIHNSAPIVSAVTAEQRSDPSRFVDIYYDLEDHDSYGCEIALEISGDGGVSWSIPRKSLSGDIGMDIPVGSSHHIILDPTVTLPDLITCDCIIKIKAEDPTGLVGLNQSSPICIDTVFDESVLVYATEVYERAFPRLSLYAHVIDQIYGEVTSGDFTWVLQDESGIEIDRGSLIHYDWSNEWTDSSFLRDLEQGYYTVKYKIITGRGRVGSTINRFFYQASYHLSGIIRDAKSGALLEGVDVELGHQTTKTDNTGTYSFDEVEVLDEVIARKPGYATHKGKISAPVSSKAVIHDIDLYATDDNKPVITGATPYYNGGLIQGIFIEGCPLNIYYEITVDWRDTQPGTLLYSANGRQLYSETTINDGPYFFWCNVGDLFTGSLDPQGNKLEIIAQSTEGHTSEKFTKPVTVIPFPESLQPYLSEIVSYTYLDMPAFAFGLSIPETPIKQHHNLPFVGKFGTEAVVSGSFEYVFNTGEWELIVGGESTAKKGKRGRRPKIPGLARYPKLKLYIGNKELNAEFNGGLRGTADLINGIRLDEVFIEGKLETQFELGRYSLLDMTGPGLTNIASAIPGLSDIVENISIQVLFSVEAGGEIISDLEPILDIERLEFTGELGPGLLYEPDLPLDIDMRLYLGGRGGFTLQSPGDLFKELRLRLYLEAEFSKWILQVGPVQYILVEVVLPDQTSSQTFMHAVSESNQQLLRPFDRSYLNKGLSRFVAPESVSLKKTVEQTTLEMTDIKDEEDHSIQTADPNAYLYTLIENVFPRAEPAIASFGSEQMLLYVSDNGHSEPLQFTDINWIFYDGNNWTTSDAIKQDGQAEFSPQVAFDGNGDAIALWTRIKSPNFNTLDVTAMATEMEIVWSKWSKETMTWLPPSQLTENTFLDHSPLLCGPMSDGSLLAVWTENQANLLMGEGEPGDTTNDNVKWSRWDVDEQAWTETKTLVPNITGCLHKALAGCQQKAVYTWTEDKDCNLLEPNDVEVYICHWNGSVWNIPEQLTENEIPDNDIKASVDSEGHVNLIWKQGKTLVMKQDEKNIFAIREESQMEGFGEYSYSLGPNGYQALFWLDQSHHNVDIFSSFYDPSSDHWSIDKQLTQDSAFEYSMKACWGSEGNITSVYNSEHVTYGPKELTFNSDVLSLDEMPTEKRADLCIIKKFLQKDLQIMASNIEVHGTDFLPGDKVLIIAEIHNTGDFSVRDIDVAFYDGNPDHDGVEIARDSVNGWLTGQSSSKISINWLLPSPPERRAIYVFVDPNNIVAECSEANNIAFLDIGGTDLRIVPVSAKVYQEGSARIIVMIQNIGAPASKVTSLEISLPDVDSKQLTTTEVPSLEPGQAIEIAVEISADLLPENTHSLIAVVDEEAKNEETDKSNNTIMIHLYD